MIFGRKYFVSLMFARDIRSFSRTAQKRNKLETKNSAFFLVLGVQSTCKVS